MPQPFSVMKTENFLFLLEKLIISKLHKSFCFSSRPMSQLTSISSLLRLITSNVPDVSSMFLVFCNVGPCVFTVTTVH